MNLLSRAALAAVAVATACGTLALAGPAVAQAGTGTTVADCATSAQVPALGTGPGCSSQGNVRHPASLTLSVDSAQLTALLSQPGQGIEDQWAVSCDEGGGVTHTDSGTLTVDSATAAKSTDVPTGGAVPSSCTVTSTVRTILGASAGLVSAGPLALQQEVTAIVATPGTLWTGTASGGAACADDTKNASKNANPVQAYTCLGDLAQAWVQDRFGEFVHDGLCMTENLSAAVVLDSCFQSHEQEWTQATAGGEVSLTATPGLCLTAPSTAAGTPLRVSKCTGAAGQRWTVPGASP